MLDVKVTNFPAFDISAIDLEYCNLLAIQAGWISWDIQKKIHHGDDIGYDMDLMYLGTLFSSSPVDLHLTQINAGLLSQLPADVALKTGFSHTQKVGLPDIIFIGYVIICEGR